MKASMIVLAALAAGPACKNNATDKPPAPARQPTPSADAAASPPWDGKTRLIVAMSGFATPESVLYDAEADVYLVANINGKPLAVDDNGFISKLGPEGKVTELKWIDGEKDDVTLDAPKGMAISGDILWVADITVVRKFDAKSGQAKGEVAIAGATFLNDVTPDGAGGVYVTDSGLDASFQGTDTDAVHHITKADQVAAVIKDKTLGHPNGVVEGPNGALWVVTFGSGELIQIDAKGKKTASEKLPKGQLDGIIALDDGELLVSSWEGETVYRGKPGAWKPAIETVKSPADIGWDAKRKRLLVPSFNGDAVVIEPLK